MPNTREILFETERLIVRKFNAGDSDDFFRVNGDEQVMKYIRPAKNREDSDAFLKENINLYAPGSVIGRYAALDKQSGSAVGTFSLLYLQGETDMHIGYALLPESWRKGYATELTVHGTAYFFTNTAKSALYAITDEANLPSQKVLVKAGFRRRNETEENGRNLIVFVIER